VKSIFTKKFGFKENNPDKGLNNFHKILNEIADADLNEKKVNVIQKISSDKKLVDLIFEAFSIVESL